MRERLTSASALVQSVEASHLPRPAFLVMVVLFAGCEGMISSSAGGATNNDTPTAPPPAVSPEGGDGVSANVPLQCKEPGVQPGFQPLLRLTAEQYVRTVEHLLSKVAAVPTVQFPPEVIVKGFDGLADGQGTSPELVLAQYELAENAAAAATLPAVLSKLAPCSGTTDAERGACVETFIRSFGRRAYRRPLSADEITRLMTVYASAREVGDYASGVQTVLRAILMSPAMVFRIESESGALNSYALATRLSYFLWNEPPDEILSSLAASNALTDVATVRTQAQRLLADPKARETVARFNRQWLGLQHIDTVSHTSAQFPQWSEVLKASLSSGLTRFLDSAFWEGETLKNLMTSNEFYVDEHTAPLVGVAFPKAAPMAKVKVLNRSGLLSEPGFLTMLGDPSHDSTVARGVTVLEKFLCDKPPPPNVNVIPTEPNQAGTAPKTLRERQLATRGGPACIGCHSTIDQIGFTFGQFDALGRYQQTEADTGLPIDTSGAFNGTRDIDGPVAGLSEVAERLGRSEQVEQCVATHWFRFAMGRMEKPDDACALKPIVTAFSASRGNMKGLLVDLATSDAFRFRQSCQEKP